VTEKHSGWMRQPGDTYVTPAWCYDAIYSVEDFNQPWDCAPVEATFDFLETSGPCTDIVTNPPFRLSVEFVRHALERVDGGKVAMLLPMEWDAAKTRRDLFEDQPFKAKYTLVQRIRWTNLPQRKNGPSKNHAWFVWDWQYEGKPFLGYLPKIDATPDKRVG
jgi:hypothetical protein